MAHDPELRHRLQRLLGRVVLVGGDAAAAANATEALVLFEALDSDVCLLITDVVMPGMRGPDLAARLRESVPALPVLFISAYAGASLRAAGLEGEQLLEKPFSAEKLLARVASLISTKTPRLVGPTKDA